VDGKSSAGRVLKAWRGAVMHRGLLAAIPVVLVNAVAVIAQLAFLRTHLTWMPAGKVLVAVTLESVAVYLAWQAHLAIMADDSAMRLRLAAYAFAAIVGAMNYSHYRAPGWQPTFPALVFGLCSVISPWLWAIHSRRQSRDSLKARGLIEPHAVRLGATRWTWHAYRSARVMWHATWAGENDPAKAIALAEKHEPAEAVQVTLEPAVEVTPEAVASQPESASQVSVQVRPKTTATRKAQVRTRARPARISDADLKKQLKSLFDADPDVSVNAAASQVGRGRDRVRPLLEEVRREVNVTPMKRGTA
jgi:hypothetical protein